LLSLALAYTHRKNNSLLLSIFFGLFARKLFYLLQKRSGNDNTLPTKYESGAVFVSYSFGKNIDGIFCVRL